MKKLIAAFVVFSFSSIALAAYQTAFEKPEKLLNTLDSNPNAKIKTVKSQCAVYPNFALVTVFQPGVEGDQFLVRTRKKKEPATKVCSARFQGESRKLENKNWLVGVIDNYLIFRDKGRGSMNQMQIVDAKSGAQIFSDSYNEDQGLELKPSPDGQMSLSYFKGLEAKCNPVKEPKCWPEIREKNQLPNETLFDESECRKLLQTPAADAGSSNFVLSTKARIQDLRHPKIEFPGGEVLCSAGI